jgi:hypothetical protein
VTGAGGHCCVLLYLQLDHGERSNRQVVGLYLGTAPVAADPESPVADELIEDELARRRKANAPF